MALTNNQITAQNFKDFYNQIRPYLNGNVPTFANTFNKSDLYSTDEQLVGRWIDGKPLYQKVISLDWTVAPSGNVDIFVDDVMQSNSPIDGVRVYRSYSIIDGANRLEINQPFISSGVSYYIVCQYVRSGGTAKNKISISHNIHPSWYPVHIDIIVQYTKTTDSSVSISDGNEYSLDEQIIGHWIDGKPLYQKTIIQNLTLPLNSVQVNFGDISDLHIDYGTVVELAFNEDDYWVNQSDVAIWLRKPNNNFGGRSTLPNSTRTGTAYITIKYTKTTD